MRTNLAYSPSKRIGQAELWVIYENDPERYRQIIYWANKKRAHEARLRIIRAMGKLWSELHCMPSINHIAEVAKADKKTVKKAIAWLSNLFEEGLQRRGGISDLEQGRSSRPRSTSSSVAKDLSTETPPPPAKRKEHMKLVLPMDAESIKMRQMDDKTLYEYVMGKEEEKIKQRQAERLATEERIRLLHEKHDAEMEKRKNDKAKQVVKPQGRQGIYPSESVRPLDTSNQVGRITPSLIRGAFAYATDRGRSPEPERRRTPSPYPTFSGYRSKRLEALEREET